MVQKRVRGSKVIVLGVVEVGIVLVMPEIVYLNFLQDLEDNNFPDILAILEVMVKITNFEGVVVGSVVAL